MRGAHEASESSGFSPLRLSASRWPDLNLFVAMSNKYLWSGLRACEGSPSWATRFKAICHPLKVDYGRFTLVQNRLLQHIGSVGIIEEPTVKPY